MTIYCGFIVSTVSVAREKTKSTTHKCKSNGSNSGKSGKSKEAKAEQRLVSRIQCRLCGEEGHWEEDCLPIDVDMPEAKRRVTFSGVSQAWLAETWTVAPSAESAETRLKMWTSQEIRIFGLVPLWIVLDRLQLLEQLRPSPCLEKHVTLQLWTKFNVSNLEVMAIRWRRRLLRFYCSSWSCQDLDLEAFVFPGSTRHLISRRWLSHHRCVVKFVPNNFCLESPEFGFVHLVLHPSGHLLLSLVNPSDTLDQFTDMIDFQSSSSSICPDFRNVMTKPLVRCSREIRLLTDELSQMKRELRTVFPVFG